MKTLYFALGLLLLTACCCNAMPKALQVAPGNCCFKFYTRGLPLNRVSGITKTHSSCLQKAFIVQYYTGRQICYRQTFRWAVNVYNQLHITEGSGQQH